MVNNKSILAVITARGGSKGLPGKNVRSLCKRPLIAWTIEAALTSNYIDRVVVSSDCSNILSVAERFGAYCLQRPSEIAGDTAKIEDAYIHAMMSEESEGRKSSSILGLTPANPLRDCVEIDNVIEYYHSFVTPSCVTTVVECEHHPLQANTLPQDRSMKYFMSEDLKLKNRQELPVYYQLTGAVSICDWDYFRQEQCFLNLRTHAYISTSRKSVNIDGIKDFLLAEAYLKNPGLK